MLFFLDLQCLLHQSHALENRSQLHLNIVYEKMHKVFLDYRCILRVDTGLFDLCKTVKRSQLLLVCVFPVSGSLLDKMPPNTAWLQLRVYEQGGVKLALRLVKAHLPGISTSTGVAGVSSSGMVVMLTARVLCRALSASSVTQLALVKERVRITHVQYTSSRLNMGVQTHSNRKLL